MAGRFTVSRGTAFQAASTVQLEGMFVERSLQMLDSIDRQCFGSATVRRVAELYFMLGCLSVLLEAPSRRRIQRRHESRIGDTHTGPRCGPHYARAGWCL